jgi:hypothetical protein
MLKTNDISRISSKNGISRISSKNDISRKMRDKVRRSGARW